MLIRTNLLPRTADALTLGPVILVRPRAAGDRALIEHERVHQSEQLFWQALWLITLAGVAVAWIGWTGRMPSPWWLLAPVLVWPWWLVYLLAPRFRLAAEVRGYRRQLALGGISLPLAAHYLTTGYRLGISYAQALDLLKDPA